MTTINANTQHMRNRWFFSGVGSRPLAAGAGRWSLSGRWDI